MDHRFLYVREDTPNMLLVVKMHVEEAGFYYLT